MISVPQTPPDEHAWAVLSHYALHRPEVRMESLANAGGWSGSKLWRVQAGGRLLCLRRWPLIHPTAERLQLIHGVLAEVAKFLPLVASPLPAQGKSTFVSQAGHLWELTEWRPGVADYHAHPHRSRLQAAIQTLARFHLLSRRLENRSGAAPALTDRVRLLGIAKSGGLKLLEGPVAEPLNQQLDERAPRLLSALRIAVFRSQAASRLARIEPLPLQPAIRDIHHDHVLFTRNEVTGLIDFGALRIDTPLADIARLVGSLVGDDLESRQFAFDAYSELNPLSDANRALINDLDEAGLIISGINWLNWLYVERRDMGPIDPIAQRLDDLLGRLQTRLS